ncbi:MAG: stage II sporulation protein M [Terriglobia bacterium]
MISARWLEKRKPYWERLTQLLERAGHGGFKALSFREVQELGLLYRQAASDLSSVRGDPLAQRWAEYLNQLMGRAHNLIYAGRRPGPSGIVRFYRQDFPRTFRATVKYSLAAFIVFLGTAVAGFLTTLADPAFQRFFLGNAMSDTIERGQMWTHSVLTIQPLASSAIMTNNLTVSFTMFALGITAGLGTIYMLSVNGLLMGVVSAACWQAGILHKLLQFVAAHGVLELPSIFIAGGAGLLVARGLLFPGPLSRRDALVAYGGEGVCLILGIIPILVIAGVIEAFVSPTALPTGAKFAMAALGFTLLVFYLGAAGRMPRSPAA